MSNRVSVHLLMPSFFAVATMVGACGLEQDIPESTVRGLVTSSPSSSSELEALSVSLLWYRAGDGRTTTESVPVSGDASRTFVMQLSEPPPDAAIETIRAFETRSDGVERESQARLGIARIVGMIDPDGEPDYPNWAAQSMSHILVYAADPIDADNFWAARFGGPLDVGYHLFSIELKSDAELDDFRACLEDSNPNLCGDGFDRIVRAPLDSAVTVTSIDPSARAPLLRF